MIVIGIIVRVNPDRARPAAAHLARALRALPIWPVLLLFVVVIGGIYGGFFTPTEAAAVGPPAAVLRRLARRHALGGILECLYGTAEATGMIFLILLGADMLNVFLALTQMPAELAQWVRAACRRSSCWS